MYEVFNTEFRHCFAMPNSNTMTIKPIKEFTENWINFVTCRNNLPLGKAVVVDPFAKDCKLGTITNDLNPECDTDYHMRAEDFLDKLIDEGIEADVVIYAPPYSPRQISECYKAVGIKTTQQDTQSSFYTKIKQRIRKIVKVDGYVLSFGWNSMGVGKEGFRYEEIMLVTHGGAHNDTICVAQRRIPQLLSDMDSDDKLLEDEECQLTLSI